MAFHWPRHTRHACTSHTPLGCRVRQPLIVYFGGHDLNPDAIVHQPPADKTEPDHSLTAYLWPSIPDYLHSAPPQAISKSCVILVPYISLRLLLAGQPLLRTPFQHRSPTICIMVRIITVQPRTWPFRLSAVPVFVNNVQALSPGLRIASQRSKLSIPPGRPACIAFTTPTNNTNELAY